LCFADTTLGPSFLHKIIAELETQDANINAMDTDLDDSAVSSSSASHPPPTCIVLHLRATDFPNVTAGMRAVVAGIMDKGKDLQRGMTDPLLGEHVEIMSVVGDRKTTTPSTSLAGYDIRYLEAWYKSLSASKRKGQILLLYLQFLF
jgi:hypothetical protein